MNKTLKIALGVVPFLLSAACTDPNKVPAEAAIKAAEAAAMTVTPDIAKAAPEQAKAFSDGLAAAKAAAAKQDFKTARAAAEPLPTKAAEAVAAAGKAKAEAAKKAFDEAAAQLGEKVGALKAKVAELAKAKKLPKGITKDAVKKAKEGLADLEAAAAKVKDEAAKDAAAATTTAKGLAARAEELVGSLAKKKK